MTSNELLPTLASRSIHLRKHLPLPSILELVIGVIMVIGSPFLWDNNLWRFVVYLATSTWGLLYLFSIMWAIDLFPSPLIGLGLCALILIIPLPIAIIGVKIGWPALTVLAVMYFVVITNGAIGRHKAQKEIESIRETKHPLGDNAEWIFAVSRRFTSPFVEEIYQNSIKPLLQQHGCVVECLYAEDKPSEADFWLNRMRLIFEIADFHILIEHDISSAVYVEHLASISLATARKPYPHMLQAIFGEDHPIVKARPRPCVIAITPQAKKLSYRLNRRTAIVPFSGARANRETETRHLDSAIVTLKKRRILDTDPNAGKSLMSKKLEKLIDDDGSIREALRIARTERQHWSKILSDLNRIDEYRQVVESVRTDVIGRSALYDYFLRVIDCKEVLPKSYRERYHVLKDLFAQSLGEEAVLLNIPVVGTVFFGLRIALLAVEAPYFPRKKSS